MKQKMPKSYIMDLVSSIAVYVMKSRQTDLFITMQVHITIFGIICFLSSGASGSGKTWAYNIGMMGRVFYHAATPTATTLF